MRAHQPTRIARTLAEADSLGHEQTDARASVEHLGVHFEGTGASGVICWTGLCGDPEPGYRLVKYTDVNGLCNIYRKIPC
jgi:hypothetical protein